MVNVQAFEGSFFQLIILQYDDSQSMNLPNPSTEDRCKTKSFFRWSFGHLNLEFPRRVPYSRLKNLVCPTIYLTLGKEEISSCLSYGYKHEVKK